MKNIVLWGTGSYAERLIKVITDNIVLVVDNDSRKWGKNWNGYIIQNPLEIKRVISWIDKVIVASSYWDEIKEKLIKEYKIDISKVDNIRYRQKELLLLENEENTDLEKQCIIQYLKCHPMEIFNNEFAEKYYQMEVEVEFDEKINLYYVIHYGKKMYFSKAYNTKEKVEKYYRGLLLEQDVESPHRYLIDDFKVNLGDVVLDAGVAEGNFALEVIDLVKKIYLVEADKEWVETLKYTFEPYKDKVEIIEGYLGNTSGELKIDQIFADKQLDFIKMDIEGAEVSALRGGRLTLLHNNAKLDICVYHNEDDEEKINHILEGCGYKIKPSNGYMIYPKGAWWENRSPRLVRGLLRCVKNNSEDK